MNKIPRLNFAHLPTPIEELPRLSDHLGGPRLLVKRDDQTGLAFGGNKTRKLEFLVAEAKEQGAKTLISGGALQSNHCRQTAAAAARYGFDCILVLNGEMPDKPSANLLLDQLFGAEIVTIADRTERDRVLQETFDKAIADGRKPYLVPYGGSSATGALGYAFAMEELMKQKPCEGSQPSQGCPDWIIFGTSSGGTHAGLMLGQRVFGFKGKVLGISIDESEEWLKSHVSKLATEASEKMGERIEFTQAEVLANAAYCKAGYGVLTEAEREAVKMFARYEGLLLDPVYTGRAAAGMIDLIRKGYFTKNETVLFWHTGGQPALFAEKYANKI
ncbi:MAG TPA: D-cysteine desulfhydrase family protein [Anaerolineales bacterium]|jgi:D-cysteine desulfhydrase family pyridoxal phosphate-dependent enzyme|nr:D-cysteine desulfhydrase family protein [Anaerolineales bacterium]